MKTIIHRTIQTLTASGYLVAAVMLAALALPAAGLMLRAVPTGSMNPAITAGAAVLIREVNPHTLRQGDIITYRNPADTRTTITHRIERTWSRSGVPYFQTKGDANPLPDRAIVGGMVVGKVVLDVPYLGHGLLFAKTMPGVIALVIIPGLIVIFYELRLLVRRLEELEGARENLRPQGRTLRVRPVAGASLVIVLLGAAAGTTPTTYAALTAKPVLLSGNSISIKNPRPELAAVARFRAAYRAATAKHSARVREAVAGIKPSMQSSDTTPLTDAYEREYELAAKVYDTRVYAALDQFVEDVDAARSTAESKDQFMNRFNAAKDRYFNALEVAKNQLADDLNRLGGNAVPKDQFMNGFNSAKAEYGNELEGAKNEFADSLNRL